MSRLALIIPPGSVAAWREAFAQVAPDLEIDLWPEVPRPEEVEYTLCWKPPAEALERLAGLRVIFSLGAGVDHLLGQPALPAGVPVVRMVEPSLTEGMSEFVLYQVLRFHRRMPEYEAMRARREWGQLPQRRAAECRVGVMGLGRLGRDVAQRLRALGYDVAAWSRRGRAMEGIEVHAGERGLGPFLERTRILVCLLPLTPQTEGCLDRRLFAALPKGACVVNVARGGHLVEKDLLAALDDGHIAGAALDVFREEPLPADHPFWTHPGVYLTPHVASLTNPLTACRSILENIDRFEAGAPLLNRVDREAGY